MTKILFHCNSVFMTIKHRLPNSQYNNAKSMFYFWDFYFWENNINSSQRWFTIDSYYCDTKSIQINKSNLFF